jgi:DNA-binding beta-propeller fold protein YncE
VRSTSTQSSSVQGAAIQGKVHGGQTVISGASIYLYAANNSGYGNASVSLLTSATGNPADGNGNYYVTTGSDGSFGITGDYTCPSTTSQLYLYATGGNPGSGANSAIGLLAALGTCQANSTLSSSLYVVINEVSTIATAYSIAGYATDPLQVSSPNTTLAQTGIANAFATVTNLETLSTGLVLATTPLANGGNGTVPQSEINTLANILAACINSSGPSSSPCTTLFSNAKNASNTPTDTATAALNIAHNPAANITALYGLQTGITAFQPMLSAAPSDFIVGINYSGGGLSAPAGVAIDPSGNAWVANNAGNSISEFSPVGAALSPANTGFAGGGLNLPVGIAIDSSANVWVTNYGLNLLTDATATGDSVSEFNFRGTPLSSTGFTGGGIAAPRGIAIDTSGDVWVANDNNRCISELSSSGTPKSGADGYTGGGLFGATGIAVDISGSVWVTDNDVAGLSKFTSTGTPVSASSYTGGGIGDADMVAIDAGGNVWVTSTSVSTISEFNSTGAPVSPAGYTGNGINEPFGIAIDGSGSVWAANAAGNTVVELNSSGAAISGANGFGDGGINTPAFPAIDGSGNVWVSNFGSNTITEFVGAAAPVVTPIVANLLSPYGQHAVNKP